MKVVQEKLKACIEGQTLKSLDRLSEQLDTGAMATEQDVMNVPVEAGGPGTPVHVKGENKAPIGKKKSKRKHKLKSAEKKQTEKMGVERRRPRFYCEF